MSVDCYKKAGKESGTEKRVNQGKMSIKSKFEDPMLDPHWLYQTLRKEINKDAMYDVENSAKLRAIEQGTVNYEQFRQMVLGAHIRPLEKRDKIEGCQNGKRPHVVWNSVATGKKQEEDGESKGNGNQDSTQESCDKTEC